MFKAKFKSAYYFLLFVSSLLISLNSCKNSADPQAKKMPASVSSYVYAYTSGMISKTTPIKVRFTKAIAPTDKIGELAESHLLRLSPSVSGQLTWEDDHTLSFQPEKNFESAQVYIASVRLDKLFPDVPAEAKSFEFDFKTKDLSYQVEVEGLEALNNTDLTKQQIIGKVYTSDWVDVQAIQQFLTAQQNGKKLDIDWQHDPAHTTHAFIIKNVARSNQASQVQLSWNGKTFGLNTTDEETVDIPSLSDFKVTDVQLKQDQGQYLGIRFSDPLLKSQNLNGLIALADYSGTLRFVIEGNVVKAYLSNRVANSRRLVVNPGIKNINNAKMQDPSEWTINFEVAKPQVKIAGKGVIMPNSDGLIFPFEAISLNAIEVEVLKVFNNNILQFLQTNNFDGNYNLERVGRIILQEKVPLKNLNPNANAAQWTRYALDLSQLIHTDPDAIYQIRIGFRPEYALYYCGENNAPQAQLTVLSDEESRLNEDGEIKSIWEGWYGINGYYEGYSWEHRDDPCFSAYYNSDHFVQSNVMASDLGIIGKGGKDKSMFVAVSDLRTTKPISGANLAFYDYQQQLIKSIQTDGTGVANTTLDRKAFVVVAKKGNQRGYLKLLDGNALSISRFDVAGTVTQKGLKGFIYGERGVWRPGDSIYLNFILEDKSGKLPQNHPISFELYDPRGQLQQKRIETESIENVYDLATATSIDAPTGNWTAKVKVGGAIFDKVLKIETVKPNRLKINLDFGKEELSSKDEPLSADLQVNWLHGAAAQNLDAKVEIQVRATNTKFDKYGDFEFDDPARSIDAEPRTVFDGQVDNNGYTRLTTAVYNGQNAPGKMIASFKTRAFEKGGDFSTDNFSVPYSPYAAYAGIHIPKNKYQQKRFDIGKDGTVSFIVLDENGNPLANRTIKAGLYRVNWRWWWDRGQDYVSRYNSSTHFDSQDAINLTTNNKGEVKWSVNVDNWGRYMIRVCDTETGHCSGDFFYAGYPWNDDNANRSDAAMMAFSSGQEKYKVGETIQLKVPAGDLGRVLITLENGTKVIESRWENAEKGDNTYQFYATAEMAPTIYAHVSLIQPHAQTNNDLPIRMYGVIPISVENPATILKPSIVMPDELQPEQKVTIEVAESNGQPMAYTVAMVDDGLLDLTRFKTPNPHAAFYAREALGVKTWDLYDYVLGAYGGELERILSIGGDGEISPGEADPTANRFKPVVQHIGPFYLKKGQKARHEITMPNYVGSVRTMVVAASENGAYGHAEKTTPVRKALMVLPTLPRVLGPGERLQLPVSVFAMDKKVKNASISVSESSGLVDIISNNTQSLAFAKPGDKIASFDIQVKENVGVAHFTVTAKGGGETASQDIEIQVRNPNPIVSNVSDQTLKAGENWTQAFEAVGMSGTNRGVLEISAIPPINLGKRLDYLIRYPYGCIEQTTSSGFPQLYVDKLLELDERQKAQVALNIQATINRLKNFQTNEGGFAYWPGESYINAWSCNYAGHFLLEAKDLGYSVSTSMLNNWIKYQKKTAREWTPKNSSSPHRTQYNEHEQAYRLYTLALAKEADLGAMNRLREKSNLSVQSKWRLAAAYIINGKPEVARELIKNIAATVEDYTELSYTFGSNIRDAAMILETAILLDDKDRINQLLRDVAQNLSSQRWLNTQETAYSLLAIGKFAKANKVGNEIAFSYQLGDGQTTNAGSKTPVMQVEIPVDQLNSKTINVKNTSGNMLFARLILSGQPLVGDPTATSNNLEISINYKTTDGVALDPSQIAQGTDFVAEVKVKHPGTRGINYEEMALSQIFPSGWEIINTRMDNLETPSPTVNTNKAEYQDIRDDRVYTHFDIRQNQSQTYRVQLNAAYQGRFYLPTVSCEAMYDNTISARQPGRWVEVSAPKDI